MHRLFAKPTPPPQVLDPLAVLRGSMIPPRPFEAGEVVPDIWWHIDPSIEALGTWESPRDRMLEVTTTLTTPGHFCALHLRVPFNPGDYAYFGFVARTASDRALTTRVCLRTGTDTGHHDLFFPRDILSQQGQTDHIDMLAPAQIPDLPRYAPWRELILFLPSRRSLTWGLHDLRLIAL